MASIFDLAAPEPRRAGTAILTDSLARSEGGMDDRNAAARAAEAEAEKRADEESAWDLIGATQVQGGIGFLHRGYQESKLLERVDPAYNLPDDFEERMDAAGIRPEQWELFGRATSEAHFETLMGFALENQAAEETMAQFGIGAQMLAGLTDPVAFALDAATGGLARSARAGRMVNAARSGGTAAAVNSGMALGASEYDPSVGSEQVVMAAAAGLALGGALGARRGEQWLDSDAIRDLAGRDITGAFDGSLGAAKVDGLIDEPVPGMPRRAPSDAVQAHKDRALDELDIRPAYADIRVSLAARMGNLKSPLARSASRWLFRDGVGYTDRNKAVQQSAGEEAAKNRAVLHSQLLRSYNTAWGQARKQAGIGMFDREAELAWSRSVADTLRGVKSDDPTVNQAAAGIREALDNAFDMGVKAGVIPASAKNPNYFPQQQSKRAYQRMLGDEGLSEDQAVEVFKGSILSDMRAKADPDVRSKFEETEATYEGTSPAVVRAREVAEQRQQRFGEYQERVREAEARVADVADVPGKKGDVQRRAAKRRLAKAQRRLSQVDTEFRNARAKLGDALKKEDADRYTTAQAKKLMDDGGVDEELAEAFARALVNRGRQQVHGDDGGGLIRPLDFEDLDALRDDLIEGGASAEKVEGILAKYRAAAGENQKHSFAKRRIQLDPDHKVTMVNRFGREVEVSVTDFLENDTARVVASYINDISGWSALAKVGNVRSPAELKALRNAIKQEAADAGDNADSVDRMFDVGVKSIMGRSTETNPNSGFSRASRALRDTQFIRVMNQVGATLFTELGPVIAHAGIKNVLRAVPEVGDFMRRAADGKLEAEDTRFMEDLIAPGTESLRNPPYLRLEEDGFAPSAYGQGKFGTGLENLTQHATRATSMLSGMAPMNAFLQRWMGKAAMLKLLDLANKPKLSDGTIRRLRGWGLDEDTQRALFASLKGKRTVADVREADLSFEDRERVAAFLFRVTRHAVIEGDASDSIMLMHNAAGKIGMQFRSFLVYSYERHFLNSAYHWKDFNTYIMVALSTSIAGLQWTARTAINNAHDEEKRKELLTAGNFAKAAVGQSSWGGVVPLITDTVAPFIGADPVFANTRSTGLSNNALGGIPTVDWLSKVGEAATLPAQALRDDREVTRRELENAAKVFWFQNLWGWQNIQKAALKEAADRGYIAEKSQVETEARAQDREEAKKSWAAKSLFGLDTGD